MKKSTITTSIIAGLVVVGGLWITTSHAPAKNDMVLAGNYRSFEEGSGFINSDKTTVLFFYASRCPSCRSADKDIRGNTSQIPENMLILRVNYDDAEELKQKYQVTTQTTFVHIDKQRNIIKKTSGLLSLTDIVKFTQGNETQ